MGADSPGADGSGAGAAVAGPAPDDSARVDDSGAEVVVASSSWSCTALAALMMSKSLLYKLKRAGYLCDQMQTYSLDFFLTSFFTRKARRGVSVAGGGVCSADGVVPAMAMVTAAMADGPVPISSGSVLGEEAGRLQVDTVSV
jgi:hypothetical protein